MGTKSISQIPGGTVTSPQGFQAGAVYAGIKKDDTKLDLGILHSEVPAEVAGVFTTSNIRAAAVTLCQERLKQNNNVSALVVNAGCANAYTGNQGMKDCEEMAALAGEAVGALPNEVLVASTGVTGQLLPMSLIRDGMGKIMLSPDGGRTLARAIMTTDSVPKEAAVYVKNNDGDYIIGGIAKGSGMIHPNMATMFCFLTTDAKVEGEFLKTALKKAVDLSFNMISIDGDTSPSDTVIVLANGMAGGSTISSGSVGARRFQRGLNEICITLAKDLARDGEGATKLIEVTINGAKGTGQARTAAREVIGSTLIKTAVHGGDPNWGRIIMALAQSGIDVELQKIDLSIGNVDILESGRPLPFNESSVVRALDQNEVPIHINLNLGRGTATAWGCDLSEEYVGINSEYMT
ncbi:MAG: bifunctional glutamate N-acetyltransferase/amino-acid acetyltransferase ArgJ [Dehalococcoidales bacterium]|nr:MAG: bifunctional glutamate N-acetyltransferase/amino-acid acetyltransferase ArgJ [Dehalococcoidales bacterium]